MNKQLYLLKDGVPIHTVIRNYTIDDVDSLIEVQTTSFPPPYPEHLHWNREQISEQATRFPEGAICAVAEGRIIGSMTGLIVNMNDYSGTHSWSSISDDGYIRNHQSNGDTLYVVDLCVTPQYRKTGVGKWLMQSMYETVVHLRLQRLLGGGRMPGYASKAKEATPMQYVEKVMNGEWSDPVISFLLRCGRSPLSVMPNYLEDDESLNHALLMEWRNPFLTTITKSSL
ncbi:GNAT family N-acetyltransferase [Paenibacillus sp. L3-i20]|uniref:GNAT family N-acetyltransferase n=1 Tax=Paenibacillus sp. L3-i20 TaxID=2905833 RepID=UPI001EDF7ABE|nr:GNAT family N-acetyltransferase [Paenibacillus sp. L3-i20]GKU79257.1 putative N-acetyltransferase YkwB [Paenibacillus sp. L3-i20]